MDLTGYTDVTSMNEEYTNYAQVCFECNPDIPYGLGMSHDEHIFLSGVNSAYTSIGHDTGDGFFDMIWDFFFDDDEE